MSSTERIAIVLRPNIPTWQALNVAAFLAGGIAVDGTDVVGDAYVDGSGSTYCRLFNRPVMVFQASPDQLRNLVLLAHEFGVLTSVFSVDMLKTNNDTDNRATIVNVATTELDLLGLAVLGSRSRISRLLEGVAKHE